MTWSAAFKEPIELPDGLAFRSLRDAATYILQLPKADQDAKEWRDAMESLILVAENNGPHRHHEGAEPPHRPRVQSRPQREAWGKRKLKRDQ